MKQALVTGGAGFIGGHLVESLVAQGVRVRVIDDFSNGLAQNLQSVRDQIEVIEASIENFDALLQAAEGCDTLFHLAAVSNVAQTLQFPAQAHAVNATGTLHVLEAARAHGCHVVYSSSAATYGDTPELPKLESGETAPISLYGTQKLLGEHYLRNYGDLFGVTGVALRYFNVYGPRQRPDSPYSGVISIFADRARRGEAITIFGDGQQTRDFVYVADVVAANIAAAGYRHPFQAAINVGTGQEIDLNQLAQTMIRLTGDRSVLGYGPRREGDIVRSVANVDRLKTELGVVAQTDLATGLKHLLDSLR